MKKFIVAILAILYISSSTGATVYMHYCMGDIANWGIGHNDSKTCGKCGMEKKSSKDNGCCNTTYKDLKVKDSHVPADAVKTTFSYLTDFSLLTASYQLKAIIGNYEENFYAGHVPPLQPGIPLHILFCTFLI